MSNWCHW